MRSIVFTATALKDFVDWARTDAKLQQRLATLIFDILRDPFQGLGKPESHDYRQTRAFGSARAPASETI